MIFYLTHAAEYLEMKQKNALTAASAPASVSGLGSGRNNSASDPERPGTGREGAPQHAAEEFTDLGLPETGDEDAMGKSHHGMILTHMP